MQATVVSLLNEIMNLSSSAGLTKNQTEMIITRINEERVRKYGVNSELSTIGVWTLKRVRELISKAVDETVNRKPSSLETKLMSWCENDIDCQEIGSEEVDYFELALSKLEERERTAHEMQMSGATNAEIGKELGMTDMRRVQNFLDGIQRRLDSILGG